VDSGTAGGTGEELTGTASEGRRLGQPNTRLVPVFARSNQLSGPARFQANSTRDRDRQPSAHPPVQAGDGTGSVAASGNRRWHSPTAPNPGPQHPGRFPQAGLT